ncbi:hypothetical protein [Helicobacter pylori]|nr:hypothetical protein [Helicobacter pylori]
MCEFDAVFAFDSYKTPIKMIIKMIEKRQNPMIIAKDWGFLA